MNLENVIEHIEKEIYSIHDELINYDGPMEMFKSAKAAAKIKVNILTNLIDSLTQEDEEENGNA